MVSMNPVVDAAARPAELSSRSRRYTADQSRLAPSANTAQKPTAPISSAERGGSANRGGGSSSSAGCTSRTQVQAGRPSTVRTAAASAKCTRASEPRWAARVPPAEPTSAPALHMPCRPDMIDFPSRRSTSTPSAFIATSAMPELAP